MQTIEERLQDWIEVTAAAKLLKVNLATVYRWIQKGKLTKRKFGGRNRVSLSELEALLTPREPETVRPSEAAQVLTRQEQSRQTREILKRAGFRV